MRMQQQQRREQVSVPLTADLRQAIERATERENRTVANLADQKNSYRSCVAVLTSWPSARTSAESVLGKLLVRDIDVGQVHQVLEPRVMRGSW